MIRRLDVHDARLLVTFRREALDAEPLAFAASPEGDVALALESVRGFLAEPDTQAVFGAFVDAELAGMIGLARSLDAASFLRVPSPMRG